MADRNYRVLCIGETWQGSDARASFAALRRLGHSVQIIDDNNYVPNQWRTVPGRAVRKLFRPILVNELRIAAINQVSALRPHCLFVFKGNWVHPSILEYCRQNAVAAVNYYPDVSFLSHGPYIPRGLPLYDHVFTTKSYGIEDMRQRLGVTRSSYLPLGYDPELHAPVQLTAHDREKYGCDVTFVGTWSPKKEQLLSGLKKALPRISVKIWGTQWEKSSSPGLAPSVAGFGVVGEEYVKALCGATICLGLLSEQGVGASSGDRITARTFQIPACGAFMLHERTDEARGYFEEGREAAYFSNGEELAAQVERYVTNREARDAVAAAGLQRARRDHSIDRRVAVIVEWLAKR